ncbi:hypothetical protein Hanom_Chr12g01173241 [Helianthus anomalus]
MPVPVQIPVMQPEKTMEIHPETKNDPDLKAEEQTEIRSEMNEMTVAVKKTEVNNAPDVTADYPRQGCTGFGQFFLHLKRSLSLMRV